MTLPDGYALVPGTPSVEDYLALRRLSGLSPKNRDQAVAGLPGSWSAVHVVHDGGAVAMGRVIGDGGWYFHVIDMAVFPQHQRRGLGDAVLSALLDDIRTRAPAGAWVTLMADAPGRRLYVRHGFTETAPTSLGMAMRLP